MLKELTWDKFLQSVAISYVAPSNKTLTPPSNEKQLCPQDYYWHTDLLQKWRSTYHPSNVVEDDSDKNRRGVASINYGAHILLATFLAEKLFSRLSLTAAATACDGYNQCKDNDNNGERKNRMITNLRIGIAIPEGPFLPLYILAVHALNIALSLSEEEDDWLVMNHNHSSTTNNCYCNGIVLIPLEADEAPERLQHMLQDSAPNLIVAAPGKDMDNIQNVLLMTGSSSSSNSTSSSSSIEIELLDFTQLIAGALSSLDEHNNIIQSNNNKNSINSLVVDQLWPREIRKDMLLDSSYDVARLVAAGLLQLVSKPSSSLIDKEEASYNSTPTPRQIISHIVYTSGTTGKPKGCVSSLTSLQHYIRAKNTSHDIDTTSNVLLASAITFDPCLSDILATCVANCTLCVASRDELYSRYDVGGSTNDDDDKSNNNDKEQQHYTTGLTKLLRQLDITHVLCTPTLWSTVEGMTPHSSSNIPSLKVVALGGEPIPKSMISRWARTRIKNCQKSNNDDDDSTYDEWDRQYPRLCATYGVTEACVYQTMGEVVLDGGGVNAEQSSTSGNSVGLPLLGTTIHICQPRPDQDDDGGTDQQQAVLKRVEHDMNSITEPEAVGEVVLSGAQVDDMSSYLNLPEVTSRVFVKENGVNYYRTGDLGYIDQRTGKLYILGRIKGDGMVKINGIRIELAEIENSVIDDALICVEEEGRLVADCMAAMVTTRSSMDTEDTEQHKQLVAYCILSSISITQLGISSEEMKQGVIVSPGPLLAVLRARCDRRVRKGCTPSFFVLIDRFPLSPTGKRNRLALPSLADCCIMGGSSDNNNSLWQCGKIGVIVADKICECLNLQPCQRQLVTLDATFSTLGGDSLAATRVVRGLYAKHYSLMDSRNLGGNTGTLDGPFATKYLLGANSLGDYVKFLDSKLAYNDTELDGAVTMDGHIQIGNEKGDEQTDPMYESLITAITLGQTSVALSLLDLGVNPNSHPHTDRRLGKVKDRKQQRVLFKSSPLHLACARGNPYLVKQLIECGCKPNIPDATGSFAIHLACSSSEDKDTVADEEDLNRLECVKLLLNSGRTPISIKDGNRQTILHSCARSSHNKLLKYIMSEWKVAAETTGMQFKSHGNEPGRIYDWTDRWFRTPVHWAVLNKRVSAIRILLDGGCSAFPPKPKAGISKRSTGVIIETPLEMCIRLYGDTSGIGKEISCLLKNAEY